MRGMEWGKAFNHFFSFSFREHTKQQLQQWRITRSSPGSHAPPPPTTSPKQPPASSPPHKELQDSTATPHHQPDSLVSKRDVYRYNHGHHPQWLFLPLFGQDGGEIFAKERESMASESASKFAQKIDLLKEFLSSAFFFPVSIELIGELLSSSKSPQSTPTSSHSLSSSNKGDSLHTS